MGLQERILRSWLDQCCVMQDCGKPFYTSNYLAFFYAIKQQYPDMQLIANCNMGEDAPTEMWDW